MPYGSSPRSPRPARTPPDGTRGSPGAAPPAAVALGACLAARLLRSLIPWGWPVTALAVITGALLTGALAFLLGGVAAA
ncbi:hypothetical protein OH807_36250 [Kitasatospora sp. NBC_01560]|uniref:hypothetical protein n=1 Tax=Kitasatospora sp. NBC_01560 TaxID=2975965 RepID=UPI00386582FD